MADVLPFAPVARPFLADVVLPSEADLEAERALLGSILMNAAAALPKVPAIFSAEHFADDLHRAVFEAAQQIGHGASALTVANALALDDAERRYLIDLLTHHHASPRDAGALSLTVLEAHSRRQIAQLLNDVRRQLEAGSAAAPAQAIADMIMGRMDDIASRAQVAADGLCLDDAVRQAIEDADLAAKGRQLAGRSTGMASVDEAIGGLEDGTYNVLGARPGQGKTALAVQWARHIAAQCKADGAGGVLGISLEMRAKQLGRRVLADAARVSVVDLKRGRIEGQMGKLIRVQRELAGLPLWIEDAGGQTIAAIRHKARKAQRRFKKLALIWVDHITIVKPDDTDRRHGATQAVGRISNALRDLSKEFECPVLALAQLNRGLLQRDDKRPNLGDLRQAGDIEQDADNVMFIHREEAYLPKSDPPRNQGETEEKYHARMLDLDRQRERLRGKAELIFEKTRDGANTAVPLLFDGPTTSFREPGPETAGSRQTAMSYAHTEPRGFWPDESH